MENEQMQSSTKKQVILQVTNIYSELLIKDSIEWVVQNRAEERLRMLTKTDKITSYRELSIGLVGSSPSLFQFCLFWLNQKC